VTVVGRTHRDAGVAGVLARQATRLQHTSNIVHTWEPLHLARALVRSTRHFQKAFLCNSGTEANEAALKFARSNLRIGPRLNALHVAHRRPPNCNNFSAITAAASGCASVVAARAAAAR
jgi:acetylornithine/succinyldiaminopimelate/putrescine aminotransferase